MKYLVLFLLVMVSDANAYDVMNDIREERLASELSGDSVPIDYRIVIGIIVLMYVMYGLFKKSIRMKDLFDFIFICFDLILFTLVLMFSYIPTFLLVISMLYIQFAWLLRISNWDDYVKRYNGLDKE